ncbi:hypothetical protein JTB14_017033 [Gonioctena quinquepunctata]|nr:hypothetical protein JTB14_017033 [Gonioctena quinquepunctata]
MNGNQESTVISHSPTQGGAPASALELPTLASRGDLESNEIVPSPESSHGAQRGAYAGLPLETRSTNQIESSSRELGDEFYGFERTTQNRDMDKVRGFTEPDQMSSEFLVGDQTGIRNPSSRNVLRNLLRIRGDSPRGNPADNLLSRDRTRNYRRGLVEGEYEFLSDRLSSRLGTTATLPEHRAESSSPFRSLYGSPLIHEPEENQNQWRPRTNSNVAPAPERRVTFSEHIGMEGQGFVRNSLPQGTLAENAGSADTFRSKWPSSGKYELYKSGDTYADKLSGILNS